MNLIPIEKRDFEAGQIETVNARDLHAFLEVGKDFSNWIKDRIEQYSFAEGQDFVVFANSGENPQGGRPAKEYAISLDMAKELSMVERNERGKQARAYFIEMERRAKMTPMQALNDPAAMRGLLLTYTEKVLALESKVAEMQPDVAALERIAKSDGSLCVTDAAKTLQVKPKGLFQYLRSHGWIYQRPGTAHDVGYQNRIQSGDLEHKTTTVLKADGEEKTVTQVRITSKGLAKLAKLMGPGPQIAA
jgi:anti-repressor protein